MTKVLYCGVMVSDTVHPVAREFYFMQKGGQWKGASGQVCGRGNFYHYKQAIKLIWPDVIQHRWFDLLLKEWLENQFIGVMGPRNSGKSFCAAIFHLVDYYAFPHSTTIMVCSTTKERMEDRIWGEIKKYHRDARRRVQWLPGHLIEGKQRIVTDDHNDEGEGRDFRNGLVGVPCKKGNQFVGIADFQGIKNKRVRLVGDELAALPKTFVDAIVTLDAQGDVKVTGMGNPATTIDALGILCEPAQELGGWESGIDQSPKTKVWRTRFDRGVCVQLPGSDSPNMDEPEAATKLRGAPLYPFIIGREQIEKDAKTWGRDDWHFTMFCEGRMPRGQGTNRIITRQRCLRGHALEEPLWLNQDRIYITALDAAYRAVGGDRCVLMRLAFGLESAPISEKSIAEAFITQDGAGPERRTILALLDTLIVPIKAGDFGDPEDQIVAFVKKQHEAWGIPAANHFFDAGMRTVLVSRYGQLWSTDVNTVDFGGKPTERRVSYDIDVSSRDYYQNFVTELWYAAGLAIDAGQVRGMNEDLVLEGCAREYMRIGSNKIQAEPKKDMKEKTGKSPDLFDTFVLGVEGARQKGFVIRRLGDPDLQETDNKWKRELLRKAGEARKSHQLNYSA